MIIILIIIAIISPPLNAGARLGVLALPRQRLEVQRQQLFICNWTTANQMDLQTSSSRISTKCAAVAL